MMLNAKELKRLDSFQFWLSTFESLSRKDLIHVMGGQTNTRARKFLEQLCREGYLEKRKTKRKPIKRIKKVGSNLLTYFGKEIEAERFTPTFKFLEEATHSHFNKEEREWIAHWFKLPEYEIMGDCLKFASDCRKPSFLAVLLKKHDSALLFRYRISFTFGSKKKLWKLLEPLQIMHKEAWATSKEIREKQKKIDRVLIKNMKDIRCLLDFSCPLIIHSVFNLPPDRILLSITRKLQKFRQRERQNAELILPYIDLIAAESGD